VRTFQFEDRDNIFRRNFGPNLSDYKLQYEFSLQKKPRIGRVIPFISKFDYVLRLHIRISITDFLIHFIIQYLFSTLHYMSVCFVSRLESNLFTSVINDIACMLLVCLSPTETDSMIFWCPTQTDLSITVAARFKAWIIFVRLNTEFESRSRHGCLSAYILCLCVDSALRQTDHSSKESYRLSKIKKLM
jgi:hypothetical protein